MRAVRVDILARDPQRLGDSLIRQRSHRDSGFTLIELVIVLAVLGALSAVAVPQLTGIEDEAELQAVAATVTSEVNNAFAQDLAAGTAEEIAGGTMVDWRSSMICSNINAKADIKVENGKDGRFTSLAPFTMDEDVSGERVITISVPTYESGVIGSRECEITRE